LSGFVLCLLLLAFHVCVSCYFLTVLCRVLFFVVFCGVFVVKCFFYCVVESVFVVHYFVGVFLLFFFRYRFVSVVGWFV